MPRPFADFYLLGSEFEKGLNGSTNDRGMRVDDRVALVFHQVWFEQDPFSRDVKTETLDPVKNHTRQVAVVAGGLQNRDPRLVRLAVTSLFPSRFSFCATSQRTYAQRGSSLQKAAPTQLVISWVPISASFSECWSTECRAGVSLRPLLEFLLMDHNQQFPCPSRVIFGMWN